VPINLNLNRLLQSVAGTAMAIAFMAGAQTPAPPAPAPAPASAPADQAPAAPAAPTWSVGPMDLSGFIDGYYSVNFNLPNTTDGYDQLNQLYNFNDKTDQFELSAAKLTLNHDPDPVGAHIDFIYGRTNELINNAPSNSTSTSAIDTGTAASALLPNQLPYLEQAFLSLKPPKAKGFELDFGKFVTSAGAEVIEAKDNWNYSRSLLFSWAIPYWHFGVRTSMPVSKTDTIGFQLVNGWNNISKSNGGVTGVFTNVLAKPKYTWSLNYIVGPENYNTVSGLRNLIDTTLLLTPPGKFNMYLNYDYGQNQDSEYLSIYSCDDAVKGARRAVAVRTEATGCLTGDNNLNKWQGGAIAIHEQVTGKTALSARAELFDDPQGYETYSPLHNPHYYEFTGTYEYKWVEGLLTRVEYRGDFSNDNFFNKRADQTTDQQSTLTVAFIAFFGPKR
jgi:hypothetical protein